MKGQARVGKDICNTYIWQSTCKENLLRTPTKQKGKDEKSQDKKLAKYLNIHFICQDIQLADKHKKLLNFIGCQRNAN